MKIKTDFSELEIPKDIEERYLKYKKENKDNAEDFEGWCSEEYYDLLEEYSDKLCPKKLAEFLIAWETSRISFHGGYDKEWGMSFEDNGYKYFITTFGWTGDLDSDPKNTNFHTITYKEKIKNTVAYMYKNNKS